MVGMRVVATVVVWDVYGCVEGSDVSERTKIGHSDGDGVR